MLLIACNASVLVSSFWVPQVEISLQATAPLYCHSILSWGLFLIVLDLCSTMIMRCNPGQSNDLPTLRCNNMQLCLYSTSAHQPGGVNKKPCYKYRIIQIILWHCWLLDYGQEMAPSVVTHVIILSYNNVIIEPHLESISSPPASENEWWRSDSDCDRGIVWFNLFSSLQHCVSCKNVSCSVSLCLQSLVSLVMRPAADLTNSSLIQNSTHRQFHIIFRSRTQILRRNASRNCTNHCSSDICTDFYRISINITHGRVGRDIGVVIIFWETTPMFQTVDEERLNACKVIYRSLILQNPDKSMTLPLTSLRVMEYYCF